MILVSNAVVRLVTGYDKIVAAEIELRRKWRGPLLAAYARRRQAYETALADDHLRLAGLGKLSRLAIFLAGLLTLLGLTFCPLQLYLSEVGNLGGALTCFAPTLILAGLMGWASTAVVWWLWKRQFPQPVPPERPEWQQLIKPLLPAWRDGLRGGLPSLERYEAAAGEYEFMAKLLSLSSPGYALYRLRLQPDNDVDVTVVGAKGIWVFKVETLRGKIFYRRGEWRHQKLCYLPGGQVLEEQQSTGEPFDQQWRRMAEDVSEALRRHAPGLVKRLPDLLQLRGGLVFTHPDASYDIPVGSPFNWGVMDFWLGQLLAARQLPELDERAVLQVIEALLNRHWRVSGARPRRSMEAYAGRLIAPAEARLRAWVNESP
jgi:hypothetical protein